jgi:hypothetical protein
MRFSNEIIPHRTDQMPRDRGTPDIIVQSPAIDWFRFAIVTAEYAADPGKFLQRGRIKGLHRCQRKFSF